MYHPKPNLKLFFFILILTSCGFQTEFDSSLNVVTEEKSLNSFSAQELGQALGRTNIEYKWTLNFWDGRRQKTESCSTKWIESLEAVSKFASINNECSNYAINGNGNNIEITAAPNILTPIYAEYCLEARLATTGKQISEPYCGNVGSLISPLPNTNYTNLFPGITGGGHRVDVVQVRGNYAFLGTASETSPASTGLGLLSVDISNPSSPVIVDQYAPGTNTNVQGLAFSNDENYLYVCSHSRLAAINITDPTNLVEESLTNLTSYCGHIVREGNYLFLNQFDRIAIYNLTSPTSPVFMSDIMKLSNDIGSFNHNAGYIAFVANNQLFLYDISDPTNPTLVAPGLINNISHVAHIDPVNDLIYIFENNAPEPWNSYSLNIYNISNFTMVSSIASQDSNWSFHSSQKLVALDNGQRIMFTESRRFSPFSNDIVYINMSIPSLPREIKRESDFSPNQTLNYWSITPADNSNTYYLPLKNGGMGFFDFN